MIVEIGGNSDRALTLDSGVTYRRRNSRIAGVRSDYSSLTTPHWTKTEWKPDDTLYYRRNTLEVANAGS